MSRFSTVSLAILAMTVSVALFLGVEVVRKSARSSFESAISGTDLIVGPRSGSAQLLLYSVFHMGQAVNNISFKSYEKYSQHPAVKWAVPLSLGDSHRGYRLVATTEAFKEHYKFQGGQSLELASGQWFQKLDEAVVGAEVAKTLKYNVGEKLILTHGSESLDGSYDHDDRPFQLTGVLKPTGTPIDRLVFVSLEGFEAMHLGWENGSRPLEPVKVSDQQLATLKPQSLTAFYVGLKAKRDIFKLQREISDDSLEPLSAIIPGLTLSELWQNLGYVEDALRLLSLMVLLASLLSVLIVLLASLEQRRREMAIFRSIGFGFGSIAGLLVLESLWISLAGVALGLLCTQMLMSALAPWILEAFQLHLEWRILDSGNLIWLGALLGLSVIVGFFPAIQAYRRSLSDGLSLKF